MGELLNYFNPYTPTNNKNKLGSEVFFPDKGSTFDPNNFDYAIIGVSDSRILNTEPSLKLFENIREALYSLSALGYNRIVDFGNLKEGKTIKDTLFLLRIVAEVLFTNDIRLVLLCADPTFYKYLFDALVSVKEDKLNIVDISNNINPGENKNLGYNFLNDILIQNSDNVGEFSNIGHQYCHTDSEILEFCSENLHENIRLGELRSDIKVVEPILRDSNIVSLSLSSIKEFEKRGRIYPNGFTNEEISKIVNYVGHSCDLNSFLILDIDDTFNNSNKFTFLLAELLWYFFYGVNYSVNETPVKEAMGFSTFCVHIEDMDEDITFVKSLLTNRWWICVYDFDEEKYEYISCDKSEYEQACNNIIPDKYYRFLKK